MLFTITAESGDDPTTTFELPVSPTPIQFTTNFAFEVGDTHAIVGGSATTLDGLSFYNGGFGRNGNGDTLLTPQSPIPALVPRLRSAPLRPWIPTSRSSKAVKKGRRADRTTDRLGGAQRRNRLGGRRGLDQIGEAAAAALDQRPDPDKAVVAGRKMRPGA
jgi:hypothetical protein